MEMEVLSKTLMVTGRNMISSLQIKTEQVIKLKKSDNLFWQQTNETQKSEHIFCEYRWTRFYENYVTRHKI